MPCRINKGMAADKGSEDRHIKCLHCGFRSHCRLTDGRRMYRRCRKKFTYEPLRPPQRPGYATPSEKHPRWSMNVCDAWPRQPVGGTGAKTSSFKGKASGMVLRALHPGIVPAVGNGLTGCSVPAFRPYSPSRRRYSSMAWRYSGGNIPTSSRDSVGRSSPVSSGRSTESGGGGWTV